METSDSNDKSEESASKSPANENKSSIVESSYFNIDTESPFVTSLKVMCRDGHIVYIPYSLQPIIEFIPSKGIYIKTMQKEVFISGRNLVQLIDFLGSQRVTWIKESASSTDTGEEGVFIQSIEIQDANL
ncbi:hypothetical protein GCM10011344_42700 [Dokdonia pacifica]|uniref:hypothetical protein n=1 Tax=Dokdonia pacifica TaxID=1627892 RepID=UPI000B7958FF|nr:hypothetical protein [Dokdonia pacifica]GGG37330.1 hypothetical protein GCM10011344_42700 [Dokdonia pacifica]